MEKELFDSYEEYYFNCWLEELMQAGYIIQKKYHPEPIILSEKVEYMTKRTTKNKMKPVIIGTATLMREHTYQYDFMIQWSKKAEGIFFNKLNDFIQTPLPFTAQVLNNGLFSFPDVKGGYGNSRLSSDIQFPINQKWVYQKYGIYVQKIVLIKKTKKGTRNVYSGLFPETFIPERYLRTDANKKARVINFEYQLLDHFLNKIKFKRYDKS